jgi:hypothetical protein
MTIFVVGMELALPLAIKTIQQIPELEDCVVQGSIPTKTPSDHVFLCNQHA